jgi:hypothetical protein
VTNHTVTGSSASKPHNTIRDILLIETEEFSILSTLALGFDLPLLKGGKSSLKGGASGLDYKKISKPSANFTDSSRA